MRRVRSLSPAMLRAYRLSLYRAGALPVRIGVRPKGPWPLPGNGFALLGACNPGGRRMPDGINRAMMHALETALRDVPHVAGGGGLGRWWEPMIAACLPVARARLIARRFGQNAIVMVRRGAAARLVRV